MCSPGYIGYCRRLAYRPLAPPPRLALGRLAVHPQGLAALADQLSEGRASDLGYLSLLCRKRRFFSFLESVDSHQTAPTQRAGKDSGPATVLTLRYERHQSTQGSGGHSPLFLGKVGFLCVLSHSPGPHYMPQGQVPMFQTCRAVRAGIAPRPLNWRWDPMAWKHPDIWQCQA